MTAAQPITSAGLRYPSLLQINTRVWLTDLARRFGRPVTLDDIPDEELDSLAGPGFDWIWLLSVWQIGAAGRKHEAGTALFDGNGDLVGRARALWIEPRSSEAAG